MGVSMRARILMSIASLKTVCSRSTFWHHCHNGGGRSRYEQRRCSLTLLLFPENMPRDAREMPSTGMLFLGDLPRDVRDLPNTFCCFLKICLKTGLKICLPLYCDFLGPGQGTRSLEVQGCCMTPHSVNYT